MSTEIVEILKANISDMKGLRSLCENLYTVYFGDHWDHPGLELYLEEQFGVEKLKSDLMSPLIDYYFILLNGKVVGFLKINNNAVFERFTKSETAELEKMYIFPEFKGKGIGKDALNGVIETIRRKEKKMLFLDVLDTNKDAIGFYEKVGFKFHSKKRLKYDLFKEELKGLYCMYLEL